MGEPNLWNVVTWLAGLIISGVCWWLKSENAALKQELKDVRDYASTRFHEVNNKIMQSYQDIENDIGERVSREEFTAQVNLILRLLNGKH